MLARRSFDIRCDAWQYAENEIGASFNFPRSDHTSRVTLQRTNLMLNHDAFAEPSGRLFSARQSNGALLKL